MVRVRNSAPKAAAATATVSQGLTMACGTCCCACCWYSPMKSCKKIHVKTDSSQTLEGFEDGTLDTERVLSTN